MPVDRKLEIRARDDDYGWAVRLYGMVRRDDTMGRGPLTAVATNMTLEQRDPAHDHYPLEAFVELDTRAAQLLLEDLWQIGLRPRDWQGGPESEQHLRHHLADMRRIAFTRLGVEEP